MKKILLYILLLFSMFSFANNCNNYKQEKEESIGGTISVSEIDSCTWVLTANPMNNYKFAYWKNLYGTIIFEKEILLEIDTTIQNYLYEATFVKDNAFIYKWLDDSIIIRTDTTDLLSGINAAGWSYTLVNGEIRMTDEDERITKLDWGIWKSDVTEVINNNEYSGLPLHMIIHDSCGSVSAVIDTVIPIVIHDTMYAHTIDFHSDIAHTDLQVLEDAVLYVDSNVNVNGILDIHEGGKVVVNENNTLTTQGIILRGDGITKKWAQLLIKGTVINNNDNMIYYDYTLNSSEYYPLSLPDSVYCNSIKSSITGDYTAYMSYLYNTALRNTHNSGWEVFNDELYGARYIMGNGYIMYSPSNKWKNNNTYKQKTNIIRYPISVELSNEKENKHIGIYCDESVDIRPSDKNWNLIGNPYISDYKIDRMNGTIVYPVKIDGDYAQIGDLVEYITYSTDGYKTYEQSEMDGFILKPFNCYFIQINEGTDIIFNRNALVAMGGGSFAPKRNTMNQLRTGVTLTQGNRTEHIGFLYGNYTDEYEINADLAKMFGNAKVLYAYSLSHDDELAFQAIPIDSIYPIPLGYKNANNTKMTFSFDNERYTNNNIYSIWLYDSKLNEYTNLSDNVYTFTPNSSNEDNRFYVTIEFNITTDTDKTIYECDEIIFDVLGRMVSNIHTNGIYVIFKNGKYTKIIK